MSFGNAVHIFKYQSSKPYNSIGRQTNKQTIFKIVVQVKIQQQGHKQISSLLLWNRQGFGFEMSFTRHV